MSEIRDRLTKLRQQEQESRGYGTSSAWYTALRPAISYLELAETATNPAEKFRNAWNAVYNLTMMMHRRGEIENVTFTHLIAEVEAAPKVRGIALATPTSFLEALKKAQTSLLFDAESKRLRESKQLVELWLDRRKKGGDVSPEKACRYLFLIGRDLRNALSHPKLDPNSSVIKKALAQAADIFVPLAVATTEAIIERPPQGTTGRVIAYRSFLYPFLKNSDSPFSDYYLERLFPEQELSAFPEAEGKASLKEINKELEARRKELVRADAEETLQRWCVPVLFEKLGLRADRGVTLVADDGVFEPAAVIKKAELQGRPRHEYKAKDAGRDLACLIWVLPWSVSLDAVSHDEQFESLTMLEVAQRALSRGDVDWAILTNGQQARLLSKTTSHKARSFMEIDLVAIVERRGEREAQLAFSYLLGLCSQGSIVERDSQGRTRLDRALRESERHGREISDELKKNVFTALEELGEGFLGYMRSMPDELDFWRAKRAPSLSPEEFLASQELLTDIYQESLSLMYRLLFLFYAESRDLLPMDEELYRDTYSLESIRDDIIATHDDPSPTSFFGKGDFNLWARLKELFEAVDGGWRNIIPAYNGGLFDPEQHQFLERFKINDNQLASAIDLLSRTKPGAVRGEGRKKVTYRDLDIRHLGSIYEGILEYHAVIADQEKAIVKRGAGSKADEEYVGLSGLTLDERKHLKAYRDALAEDDNNPTPPRGCKVSGLIAPGEYYLIYGGRESKRKSSGSYYTPDYVVQYIVENTLGPLVRGECRAKPEPLPELLKGKRGSEEEADDIRPLSGDEILELKVLDPAMGSGHFLVYATEYLARAYGSACIREGKDKDGVMSDDQFVHYKRIIAERCIYGVDINPMAVELSKLSMWLFTMDKGRPLSFVNHQLKCGNAVVGAWTNELGQRPEFDEKGKRKKSSRKDTRTGNLFEAPFREKVPTMVRDILSIMHQETITISDVKAKKLLDSAVEEVKRPFKNIANIWVGLHFGEESSNYNDLLSNPALAREGSPTAGKLNAFNWELEFPEVWYEPGGRSKASPAFDAIVGNPPYHGLQGTSEQLVMERLFPEFYSGSDDILYYFIRQLAKLLRDRGRGTFIVSRYWTESQHASNLRSLITDTCDVINLVDFRNFQPFGSEVSVICCIPFFAKGKHQTTASVVRFEDFFAGDSVKASGDLQSPSGFQPNNPASVCSFVIKQEQLRDAPWYVSPKEVEDLLQTISNDGVNLGSITSQTQGIKTGLNTAFVVSSVYAEEQQLEPSLLLQLAKGKDVFPFCLKAAGDLLIYTHGGIDIKDYPRIHRHLLKFQQELEKRAECSDGMYPWWRLQRPRDPKIILAPKVLTPLYATHNRFAITADAPYAVGVTDTIAFVVDPSSIFSVHYIAGILNSTAAQFFHKRRAKLKRANYYEYIVEALDRFPIPRPDRNVKAAHQIIDSVKTLLTMKPDTPAWRLQIEEVDDAVFSVYGFGLSERKLITRLASGVVEGVED